MYKLPAHFAWYYKTMQVTITYTDEHALTTEEVVSQAVHNYGKQAVVEVMPDSQHAHDLIYFGLQKIITHEQLSLYYEGKHEYQNGLKKLRSETLYKIQEIIDQVIIDNEGRVA